MRAAGEQHTGTDGREPTLVLCITAAALILHAVPPWGDILALRPAAAGAARLGGLLFWHLTHWSGEHLVWDVLAFVLAGVVCERHSRRRLAACLLLAGPIVTGTVLALRPEIPEFRGLSGLDCALYALAACLVIRHARRRGRPGVAWVAGLAALAYAAKVGYEAATGGTVFAGMGVGVVPLPEAHLAGGLVGLACGLLPAPRRLRQTRPPAETPPGDAGLVPAVR